MFNKKKKKNDILLNFSIGAAVCDHNWWGEYGHVVGFELDDAKEVKVIIKVASGEVYSRYPESLKVKK